MTWPMTRTVSLMALLAPLLALAACGTPASAPGTPEAACRAESRNVPAIREAERRMPDVNNMMQRRRAEEEVALIERRAYLNCMRLRGLTPPGSGVEPERRF